jgi:hypothetical protein
MCRFSQNSVQKTILKGIVLQNSPPNRCKSQERENPGFTSDFLIGLVFLHFKCLRPPVFCWNTSIFLPDTALNPRLPLLWKKVQKLDFWLILFKKPRLTQYIPVLDKFQQTSTSKNPLFATLVTVMLTSRFQRRKILKPTSNKSVLDSLNLDLITYPMKN